MRALTIVLLSTFIMVGLYVGIYTLLYTQKVTEAQSETSIQTPKKIIQLLRVISSSAFILASISFLFLCYELFIQ